MNKKEASHILQREFCKYRGMNWADALTHIGKENVEQVSSPSGIEYYFELYVSYVDEREMDIEVEGMVSEAKGKKFFPPMVHESYCIENPQIQDKLAD